MVKNTILDGVVLSQDGYATAVSAAAEETLQGISQAVHCREVLLLDTICTSETLDIFKDLMMTGPADCQICIKSQNSAGEAVIEVNDGAVLTIAPNVEISTNGTVQTGIHIKEDSILLCYGQVDDSQKNQADCGILAEDENSRVVLYPGAMVTGYGVGIYSRGDTVLAREGGTLTETGKEKKQEPEPPDSVWVFQGGSVHAASVTSGQTITGNTGNGIVQDGGTLTVSSGLIYGNGTLGGTGTEGSYGGGVRLKNGAVMNMTGGTISANCAVYGGGIYLEEGCTLNLKGGMIGGTRFYDPEGTNTYTSGNYARENRLPSNGMLYAKGGGGGICSLGKVNATGNSSVNIAYNCTEGSVGGAGLLIGDGVAHFSGNVTIHHNQALSSACGSSLGLSGSDDPEGEGAGIRLGLEASGYQGRCTINCLDQEDFPEVVGTVVIRDNISTGDGGGIFVSSDAYNQIVVKGDTSICGNTARNQGGGGIKTEGGSVFLYETAVYENTSEVSSGGGVAGAGVIDLENCEIYSNRSGAGGGGIAVGTSLKGAAGIGYVHGCHIYDNTSGRDGSGVDVQSGASVNIQGDSQVYQNTGGNGGICCAPSASLVLGVSDTYGNGGYGLFNQGNTDVRGTVTMGFASYTSASSCCVLPNESGGICNAGTMTVSTSKVFCVYGGQETALTNRGTMTFQNKTCSSFYGKNTENVILNTGTLTTEGKGFFNSPIVTVAGEHASYGLNNDGGTVRWGGTVKGNYEITDTGLQKGTATTGIGYGIYNHDAGDVSLTGGNCLDCEEYGVYCQTGSGLHMSGEAVVDTQNPVFLEQDCYIDIDGQLTADGVIAMLDTATDRDRRPGRIMAKVSYSGGNGAAELYGAEGAKRFLLAYDRVDGGTEAFLLDGSDIQGVTEAVAQTISEEDIYLSTRIEAQTDSRLEAWLYNRTAWLGSQMAGSKQDPQYQYFREGDTGVITFSCTNLTEVLIRWPDSGAAQELKTYDGNRTCVVDADYNITELTEDISLPFEYSSYQFHIPMGTPEGVYYVTVLGRNEAGQEFSQILPVIVGNTARSATFRTRIR
ncbi:MAG: hypothetical protein ACI4D7_06180, partial [Lachnospiraceae bacterium]